MEVALANHNTLVDSERALKKSLARAHDEVTRLEELLGFKRELELKCLNEVRLVAALMTVDEEDPLWNAVHSLLSSMEREELGTALRPGQRSDDRAYNNGRVAALVDFRAVLLQQWTKARVSNRASR